MGDSSNMNNSSRHLLGLSWRFISVFFVSLMSVSVKRPAVTWCLGLQSFREIYSCFRLNIIHSVITFVLVTIWTMLLLWEKILTNRQIVLRCPELKLLRLYCSNCLFKLVIVSRNFTSSAQLCATRKWSRSRQARTCVLLGYTYSYMCVCDQRTVIIKDQKDI